MIFISRDQDDSLGNPIRPTSAWYETAKDLTESAVEAAGTLAVSNHYKHSSVKVALEKLFHSKCAYCGIKITGASDWDVEHFRPKGRVAERAEHPGYYWLAYAWSNLYPACQHCNQARRDPPKWGDMTRAGPAMGKLDQFPMADERRRALNPQQPMEDEQPLMLNPCADDPKDHLSYTITGDVVATGDSLRGEATIQICHWRRRRLRDRRRELVDRILDVLGYVESAERRRLIIDRYCEDREEFAAVARAIREDPAAFGLPSPV